MSDVFKKKSYDNRNQLKLRTSKCNVFKHLIRAKGAVLENETGGFKQRSNEF